MTDLPRVLCVDDEPQILEGLALHLRRRFQVATAVGPIAALKWIAECGAPPVIISDMRMPGMDGAALLKRMLQLHPETTRILLTGEPTRDAAALAVNQGQIFRFLTKPCSPTELLAAVEAGLIQHRLVTAEKTLMQETLIGCIDALMDVLAMTNPVAFGRSNRLKRMAMELAATLGHTGFWQLEAAAMLSQLGYISLPPDLVEKAYYGQRLTPEEQALVAEAPQVARSLLARIPRIEPVLQLLADSSSTPSTAATDDTHKAGSDVLRLVLAYDALVAAGCPLALALQKLRSAPRLYAAGLIDGLESLVGAQEAKQDVREIDLGAVKQGMIILDDLRTAVGALLVPKGFEVTDAFLERKRHFAPAILQAKVRVLASSDIALARTAT